MKSKIIELSATSIIDSLIHYVDDIQECREKVPRGTYIYEGSPYKQFYDKAHTAEQAFSLATDLTGISMTALYSTVFTARRWYTRTEWQKSLPENDAQRLLSCFIEQYPMRR